MTQLNISVATIKDVHFLSYFHCHWIGERSLKAAKVIEPVLRELEVYRERGQRSLSARIYELNAVAACGSAGCRRRLLLITGESERPEEVPVRDLLLWLFEL
jgi:hypothetical protein